jgi:hypothetical protein
MKAATGARDLFQRAIMVAACACAACQNACDAFLLDRGARGAELTALHGALAHFFSFIH